MKIHKSLVALLDEMIPLEKKRGLPSGSQVGFKADRSYFDIIRFLDFYSHEKFGLAFHQLAPSDRSVAIVFIESKHKKAFTKFAKALVEHYYIQPEVFQIIGTGENPPFPVGNFVEQGDVYLLEEVFLRGKIFKEI